MPKNMVSEGKLGARGGFRVIIYISRSFRDMTVAFTFQTKRATVLRPVLRQGMCLFIGTTSKTRNNILLSTRGRRSCCSRPKVALPAAAGSTNGGRGQITFQGTWGNVEILPSSRLFFKKMLHRLK